MRRPASTTALGQTQHVDRAVDASLGRLHRIVLIVDRRGWAGEIVYLIHFDKQREGDVMADEFKPLMPPDMHNIIA